MKLSREAHGRCPIASLDSGTLLLEVAFDPVEDRAAESPRQFGDDACLKYAMREINSPDLLDGRIGNEDAALGDRLKTTLRDQAVKHLSNALAGNLEDRGQPMFRQLRSWRQTAFEQSA